MYCEVAKRLLYFDDKFRKELMNLDLSIDLGDERYLVLHGGLRVYVQLRVGFGQNVAYDAGYLNKFWNAGFDSGVLSVNMADDCCYWFATDVLDLLPVELMDGRGDDLLLWSEQYRTVEEFVNFRLVGCKGLKKGGLGNL